MKKPLTLLDCIGIGVNGIVGSGIFLLPGRMSAAAGPASVIAFLLCGALLALVALCFAEAAGRTERSGGSYAYAREAFGEPVGFLVGWMSLVSGVLGMSAVARGFAGSLIGLTPAATSPLLEGAVAAGYLLLLGALNARGIRVGARASNLFSAAKLIPLLVFVAAGATRFRPEAFAAPAGAGDPAAGVATAVFIAVFALSGFEVIPVPAAEADRSRRTVPLALIGSLAGAAILYAVIQTVAVGIYPGLPGSERPLADAAAYALGPAVASLIAVGAVVSMGGYCAGSALTIPHYFVALAEDRLFPGWLASRSRSNRTPIAAVATASILAAAGALALDFNRLVDVTVVIVVIQYMATCLSVLVLSRKRSAPPSAWKLPGGPAIPILACLVSAALVATAPPGRRELAFSGVLIVAGLALYAARNAITRGRGPAAAPPGGDPEGS